jgi:hypothetical protein
MRQLAEKQNRGELTEDEHDHFEWDGAILMGKTKCRKPDTAQQRVSVSGLDATTSLR